MSPERVITSEATDNLEVIREEQCSPVRSSLNINGPNDVSEYQDSIRPCKDCTCLERDEKLKQKMDPELVQTLLREKEKRLTEEFQAQLKNDVKFIKERCDFVLQNEQVRASYMLREAHRERQEKITALQTQLECKNLAGLMFVMCSERRKSKLEKLRLKEEYTNYILTLQGILSDAQTLILHLSKGYKTASRVDHEWRKKMRGVLTEFQMFVHDFAGGSPETNQYFFDVPALLKTDAPIVDNPIEDPCESEADNNEDHEDIHETKHEEHDTGEGGEKPWWERMDSDGRPFLMMGDMSEFRPPQRREVLTSVKAAKTAPKKWKEYVFNEMFINANCVNADVIKDEYLKHVPIDTWECVGRPSEMDASKMSLGGQKGKRASDVNYGNMGSILNIMTSNNVNKQNRSLLGARDSMEIQSTTRLREKHAKMSEQSKVTLNTGTAHRRTSFYDEIQTKDSTDKNDMPDSSKPKSKEDGRGRLSVTGSHDSLDAINQHVPEQDHKINYEKVCPMDKCQRLKVDSFMRSLPSYMRSNPYKHFEQNYEDYETCSPEQIAIIQKRIERMKAKCDHEVTEPSPFEEWRPSIEGIAVQTSELSVSLPPCTCRVPSPTPVSSDVKIFNIEDLIPMKEAIDMISKECLYDYRIQFDRFKVIGQESQTSMANVPRNDNRSKVQEITEVLRKHPSFLDIFQANTQC